MPQIQWPVSTVSERTLQDAAAVFSLLGSASRLRLLLVLGEGEQDVTSLCEALGVSGPAVSQHLAKLRAGGVVEARRDGKRQMYRVAAPWALEQVHALLGHLTES